MARTDEQSKERAWRRGYLPSPWLGERHGYLVDKLTQLWVRATGQIVDLRENAWLAGPMGGTRRIGMEHFHKLAATEGLVLREAPDAGLLERFADLASPTFPADRIHPAVSAFYESTGDYRLDVWSQWNPLFRPLGGLLAWLFSRRLEQLNVPLAPLDTSRGITSRIALLCEPETGRRRYCGWLRHVIADGRVLYAGCYGTCTPARLGHPCVKVVFPLPNGSATVIMRPECGADGSLRLVSAGRGIGDPGFYFLVHRARDSAWVRYIRTMRETIHVYANDDGTTRADHVLSLWRRVFLRFHYRMTPAESGSAGASPSR